MKPIILCVVAAVMAGGCVSKSKHQGVVAKLEDSEKQRASSEAEVKRLQRELDTSRHDLEESNRKLEQVTSDTEAQLEATKDELAELRKQREEQKAELAEFRALTEQFKEMIDAGKLEVRVRRGRMIVSLPSSVLFKSGDAQLSPRGEEALQKVAETLKTLKKRRFLVAGHTDSIKVKKSGFVDNWELSTVRALNVTRYLIGQGMSPKNLAAAGYAQYDPVKSNRSRTGRARNRRIELILVPRVPPLSKHLLDK